MMEITKEELDMYIQYLWEEELERRCEENAVLKELKRTYEANKITEIVH